MAEAKATDVFACTPLEFFAIVTDYPRYPEFLSEVKKCEVVKTEDSRKIVEYTVSIVKEFHYQLSMKEEKAADGKSCSVVWEFVSGDLFKSLKGSWKITEEAGKSRAEYAINAEFGLFVPGPIAKALVSVNLPNMMSAYHKRVKDLYGRKG